MVLVLNGTAQGAGAGPARLRFKLRFRFRSHRLDRTRALRAATDACDVGGRGSCRAGVSCRAAPGVGLRV